MKRTRRSIKKYLESSDSEDNRPLKKSPTSNCKQLNYHNESSSSESDIENYLHRPEKLDLNSEFFNPKRDALPEFEKIEKNIFAGVKRLSSQLSDSESQSDEEGKEISLKKTESNRLKPTLYAKSESVSSPKMAFDKLQDYNKKIEEAKKHIEIYKAKKLAVENKMDVHNLLAAGEKKTSMEINLTPADLHSSDFESCESEQEDWEEIKIKTSQENRESIVPQKSLQITVDLPNTVRKKKGVDLLAAMKRRLNRIRKENQVLVHKVHLLCWIAHGNYVNSMINNTQTLALALSLLPSEHCYPADRTDLSYLEQIVNWYKRSVTIIEKPLPKRMSLDKCLELQINKKEAYNTKMFACIFVAILRALGIQCRLVMSLEVEPLRPPASDLHSLSNKQDGQSNLVKKNMSIKANRSISKAQREKVCTSQQTQSKGGTSKIDEPEGKLGQIKQKKSVKVKSSTCQNLRIEEKEKDKIKQEKSNRKKEVNVITETKSTQKENGKVKSKTTKKTFQRTKTTRNAEDTSKSSKIKSLNEKEKEIEPKSSTNVTKLIIPDLKGNRRFNNKSKVEKELGVVDVKNEKGTVIRSRENERGIARNQGVKTNKDKKASESTLNVPKTKRRTKSTEIDFSKLPAHSSSNGNRSKSVENIRTRSSRASKQIIKAKTPRSKKNTIQQVDGIHDSSSDEEISIPQLDGANDDKVKASQNNTKPKLRNLKKSSNVPSFIKTSTTKKVEETNSENEFQSSSQRSLSTKSVAGTSQMPNLKKLSTENRLADSAKQLDIRSDIVNLIKGRIAEQKQVDRKRLPKKNKVDPDSDSDSDYVPEAIKKKHHDSDDEFVPKIKVKRRVQIPGKNGDSDTEKSGKKKKKSFNTWVEVFLEAEEKWISVDVVFGQVHCVKEIFQRANHPISYIIAWNNSNTLKDVTQRYCPNFNTVTRRLRVDVKWWNDSLKPFMGLPTAREREEDDDLARQQLDMPLPKSIAEYKNHPLYSLRRHLLKFEAIYPPEAPTLGFIRGEAVYPRGCVFTLHSRDIWLKQAKVVKLGEQPYKIVKARPKYDKLSNTIITDQLLEIFGPWQVQDYEPPTAENGIVPKNAFGNVDLFKPCMLPKGTVHLKLPGLNKIARRMNIDCAAAIVGFDFHGGWSHPVYDGFVVCKEYEDQLICAWELEQEEIERKEQEKIDKRVYGHWKKLIRGLLIRERLKVKYDFGEPSGSDRDIDKKKVKAPSFCTKKR